MSLLGRILARLFGPGDTPGCQPEKELELEEEDMLDLQSFEEPTVEEAPMTMAELLAKERVN